MAVTELEKMVSEYEAIYKNNLLSMITDSKAALGKVLPDNLEFAFIKMAEFQIAKDENLFFIQDGELHRKNIPTKWDSWGSTMISIAFRVDAEIAIVDEYVQKLKQKHGLAPIKARL
jgi:hypothetical protein